MCFRMVVLSRCREAKVLAMFRPGSKVEKGLGKEESELSTSGLEKKRDMQHEPDMMTLSKWYFAFVSVPEMQERNS